MKDKRIRLVILVAIIVAIVMLIMSGSSPKDEKNETRKSYAELQADGTTVNTSEKLAETKRYNGLEFTNLKFTHSLSATYLTAEVKNTTEKKVDAQLVDINILDEQGNILATFVGQINEMEPGATTGINAGIAANYADAYNLEFVEPNTTRIQAEQNIINANTNQIDE